MGDSLSLTRDGAVATLTIDRPAAHNSLTLSLLQDLAAETNDLAEDDDVRCLVLRGAGPAFCAGADLDELQADAEDGARLRRLATNLHVVVRTLMGARKPVVTGVNGVAAGGGFGLALAGDLVLVSEDARFEFAYPRIGLCGDGGSTFLLPRLLGLRRAKELVLRDEPVSAEEAVEMGLATEVVPADEFDDRLAAEAAELAEGPTTAYAATKGLLTDSFQHSLVTQLAAETDRLAGLTRTDDYRAGIEAFHAGETPSFTGR